MRWERRQKNEKESYNKNRYGDTDSSVVFYFDACSVFIRLFRREAVIHGYRKRRTFQYRLSMDPYRVVGLHHRVWQIFLWFCVRLRHAGGCGICCFRICSKKNIQTKKTAFYPRKTNRCSAKNEISDSFCHCCALRI